ncbi:hypothetical protein M413DRAFT_284953 [Hebeloma cylindrosporum]|uniref:PrpF protein n=1 Tax=Hebeloma cylindrosporum TaxID=76867 RepID=A0A0C3BXL6_HEBCY|nr:hypothetical protein M413DRAFT_284953 [Hebeloma cylindrosporum h7]
MWVLPAHAARRLGAVVLHHSRMNFATTAVPNPLPATFLRGGTSKGIFLDKSTLPADQAEWGPIFRGIMGSPDAEYGRQLNGMGGGVSSLSKIMVVSTPTPERKAQGIDVEYTFVQVGIRDSGIDYSGNCGNLTSMIGVYALDEGMCHRPLGSSSATIRCFNTNTQKIIDTTFPISDTGTPILDLPQAAVAGVPGKASKIVLDFVNPGGARTGKLLPTGQPVDQLKLPFSPTGSVRASLVDATNPTVFVDYTELHKFLPMDDYFNGKPAAIQAVSPVLEDIRQQGAIKMNLDPTAQAQPKIAILSSPHTESDAAEKVNIVIHALSMGVLHKAVPMTAGLCLGVAARIEGSIAWDIMRKSSGSLGGDTDLVKIRHPGGLVDVGAEFGDGGEVKSAKVVRTGRRLMKGGVWY